MKNSGQKKTSSGFSLNESLFQSLVVGLFNFLLIFVPLFFTFNTSELFEFNKMVSTYAITALILAAWVARMIVRGKVIIRKTYLDIPILLFVISQLLSVIFSIHPYTSLLGYYSRFHGGFSSVVTYTILYYAFISNVEKKHLSSFFLSLTGAGVLVSSYAVLEHFGHSISCLMLSGGTDFGVSCWIQDVKNRVFATFGQPNWLAAYLIMLLPVSVVLAFKEYSKTYLNIYYAGVSVLFFITLLFTQSRSGFVGAAIGIAVTVALIAWKLWNVQKLTTFFKTSRKELLIVVSGVLIAAALFGTSYTPSIGKLLSSQSAQQAVPTSSPTPVVNRLDVGGTDSGEIRKIVWQGAIKVWQRYPIFGSGLETFGYSYYKDRPIEHNHVSEWDFLYNKAHNEFLNFLATTGLVGLLSYLLLLGYFSFFCIKNIVMSSTKLHTAFLLSALFGGIVAVSVSNFFGFSTVMVVVLMYVYFGLVEILTHTEETTIAVTNELSSTSYLLLSATGLFCMFLLRVVFQYWNADVLYNRGKAYLEAGYFDQGIIDLQEAIKLNSQEATFYDELATQYSLYAYPFAQQGDAEKAQALIFAAQEVSDATLKLNSRQVNFFKTRTRVFLNLSLVDATFLQKAKDTLLEARELAPNDPKLVYNLGIVSISMGNQQEGIQYLEETIALKPDYESARIQLASAYETSNQPELAFENYTYIIEHLNPTHQQALDRIASISAEMEKKK